VEENGGSYRGFNFFDDGDQKLFESLLRGGGAEAEDDVLRNRRDEGKLVLPCKPKFPRRDKSFFQGHFAAASISVQAIRWTPI
jgi:hypothetical protein